ncbi:hypothetical protein OUZ56_026162 [Daphnia magna]|uniref:Uncharacterized protein n=1 Tax=Daphnia magna TaxID=35525 RepID=A0ABQ9ZKY3_9CRUS|nr:hypothetical protein OUZ56_026162 [Daphnia magna]
MDHSTAVYYKYKLVISQHINIENSSKNSKYHSVFTWKTVLFGSVYTWKYKLIISQCINMENRSKNSWYHSVFTLITTVKTHNTTVYSQGKQNYKLLISQCIIHIENRLPDISTSPLCEASRKKIKQSSEHGITSSSKRLHTVLLMFYYLNLQFIQLSAPLSSLLSVTCTFHAACCLQHLESLSHLDSFPVMLLLFPLK